MRSLPALTAKARIELAKAGAPIWHTVSSDQGSTLKQVVDEVCGDQPPETFDFLLAEALRLNLIENPNAVIEKDIAVAVPFCLKVERDVPVEIKSGDRLETILEENYGLAGPKTQRSVYKANKEDFDAKSFDDFALNLPIGKKIKVPLAEPQVFSPRSGSEAALESVLAKSDLSESARAQIEDLSVPVDEAGDSGDYQFRTIDSVEFESTSANCGAPGQPASVVDLELLKERFAKEEEAKRALDGEGAQSVIVGIIDSGLSKVGDDFFKEKFFAPNLREFEKVPKKDDDGNNFKDDIYGINFNTKDGDIEPYAGSGEMTPHGTKMAALLLGGPQVMSEWADSRTQPVIRLKVVNFASSKKIEANVDPPYLGDAIRYLADQGARIINMSLANAENVAAATNAIQLHPSVLFVVAAGNAKIGKGRDIDVKPTVYPARYGGRNGNHRDHVVTVGAVGLEGKPAEFSNYSDQYVDLLAPGCAVETRNDLGSPILDNGTSPATAITSFAAALVSALGLKDDAKAIKNRLLLSTDPDPSLKEESWSSGRLNILKAISLRSDVIALSPSGDSFQPSDYRFQKVDVEQLKLFCADKSKRRFLSDIRKVIPSITSPGKTEIEFWMEIDGRLEQTRCAQDSTLNEGHISLSDGSKGPRLSDIQDVTFASF